MCHYYSALCWYCFVTSASLTWYDISYQVISGLKEIQEIQGIQKWWSRGRMASMEEGMLEKRVQGFLETLKSVPELRYAGDPLLRKATSVVSVEEGIRNCAF